MEVSVVWKVNTRKFTGMARKIIPAQQAIRSDWYSFLVNEKMIAAERNPNVTGIIRIANSLSPKIEVLIKFKTATMGGFE